MTTRPRGGSLRVRGPVVKDLSRHVAELDGLVGMFTLDDIITTSRAAVDARLSLARAEVELNCWTSMTLPIRLD